MTFGEKLKAIRIERHLSQEEMADLLGTTKQVISRYELGQRSPKITVAQRYAELLQIPLGQLITNSTELRASIDELNKSAPAITGGRQQKISQLLDLFNALTPENQDKLLELAVFYTSLDQRKVNSREEGQDQEPR